MTVETYELPLLRQLSTFWWVLLACELYILRTITKYEIDDNTFEVVTDENGEPITADDFRAIIKEFKEWAITQEETLKEKFIGWLLMDYTITPKLIKFSQIEKNKLWNTLDLEKQIF